ncbi:hypothetical protein EsH8_II_001372 [Colletotrichum jinshuiense]
MATMSSASEAPIHVGETSGGSFSTGGDTPMPRPPPEAEPGAPPASSATRRRPIPRKGHTKSRKGCHGCKRRKVKCSEARPVCGGCQRMGITCEWPERPPPSAQTEQALTQMQLSRGLTNQGQGWDSASTPEETDQGGENVGLVQRGWVARPGHALQNAVVGETVFLLEDMRFFQQFLLDAMPRLPIDGEEIWRGVARMAHEVSLACVASASIRLYTLPRFVSPLHSISYLNSRS